jgi:valyl-tRNA synthetase
LLNASKFALTGGTVEGDVTHPLDRGMLTDLAALVDEATAAFEDYEYTRVIDRAESFFWSFCDNYLELVKSRRYGDHGAEQAASANRAMQAALSVILRLFAPFLPFVTEEVWSWWREGSVHRAPWPAASDIASVAAPDPAASEALAVTTAVLGEIRRTKSEAKRPLKIGIARAVVRDTSDRLTLLEQARLDLCSAANIADSRVLILEPASALSVDLEFADVESTPSV